MNKAVICIGSNTPRRNETICEALAEIKAGFCVNAMSPVYESNDDRRPDAPPYVNAVMSIDTNLDHNRLRLLFKEMECRYGRIPSMTGIVALDIDIVIFNDSVMRPDDFGSPHFLTGFRSISSQVAAES